MAETPSGREIVADLIGLVIVGVIGWWVLRSLVGSLYWLVRTAVLLLVLGALFWLYLKVRGRSEG